MHKIEVDHELAKEIFKKCKGFYKSPLEVYVNCSKSINYYNPEYGMLRFDWLYSPSDKVLVHGVFWSKKVFKAFSFLPSIWANIRALTHKRILLCEIPKDSKSLRRFLGELRFEYTLQYQQYADKDTIMFIYKGE